MANINFKRLRCMTVVNGQYEARSFNYDGNSANIGGSTDVLTIADVKATATWNTATDSTFRKGDFLIISCTDGAIAAQVTAVNPTTKVPSVSWLTETASA
jgi:maleate cis-trans isomerase